MPTSLPRPSRPRPAVLLAAALAACGGAPEQPSLRDPGIADVRTVAAAADAPLTTGQPSLGERTYVVCATCHQPNGQGVATAFPPLAGSEWVTGDPEVPIRIVLHGLAGPITVKYEPYVGVMAPLGELLGDAEIAAVLTYVRSSWGNRASAVTPEQVAAVRAASAARAGTPYRADELKPLLGH